jgi:hypothetical protein
VIDATYEEAAAALNHLRGIEAAQRRPAPADLTITAHPADEPLPPADHTIEREAPVELSMAQVLNAYLPALNKTDDHSKAVVALAEQAMRWRGQMVDALERLADRWKTIGQQDTEIRRLRADLARERALSAYLRAANAANEAEAAHGFATEGIGCEVEADRRRKVVEPVYEAALAALLALGGKPDDMPHEERVAWARLDLDEAEICLSETQARAARQASWQGRVAEDTAAVEACRAALGDALRSK